MKRYDLQANVYNIKISGVDWCDKTYIRVYFCMVGKLRNSQFRYTENEKLSKYIKLPARKMSMLTLLWAIYRDWTIVCTSFKHNYYSLLQVFVFSSVAALSNRLITQWKKNHDSISRKCVGEQVDRVNTICLGSHEPHTHRQLIFNTFRWSSDQAGTH
jgi:hypothetical protein